MNLDDLMNYEYAHDSWIQLILTAVKTGQWQHKKITLTECELWNNWLFYWDNLVVLNSELLQFKILEFAHECRWWMNCKSISSFVVFKMIWKNTTCFHKSWIQWKKSWNW